MHFSNYTNQGAPLNLASHLSSDAFSDIDLTAKFYIAAPAIDYDPEGRAVAHSTGTHLDITDAVNLLVNTSTPNRQHKSSSTDPSGELRDQGCRDRDHDEVGPEFCQSVLASRQLVHDAEFDFIQSQLALKDSP